MSSPDPGSTSRYWFWDDDTAANGYQAFNKPGLTAALNTNYISTILYAGSNSWTVYRDGDVIGTSKQNPGLSVKLMAGEEMAAPSATGGSTHSELYWVDTSGNYHSGWNGATIYKDQPPYGAWLNKPYKSEAYNLDCEPSSSAATATTSSVIKHIAASRSKSPAYGASNIWITDHARYLARANGDPNPTFSYRVTTWAKAARALPSVAVKEPRKKVVLVIMHGHFMDSSTVRARRTMAVIFDAADGSILGYSRPTNASSVRPLSASTSTDSDTTSNTDAIVSAAKAFAAQNGDASPTDVTATASNDTAAQNALAGSTSGAVTSDPVTVVTMGGDFVGNDAHIPPGYTAPTGQYMSMIYDDATNDLLYWSISNSAPNPSSLGSTLTQ